MTEAKAKRIRARVGDVFEVPLSAEQRVYGQIVDQVDRQFLVVLFRLTKGAVEDIVRSGIALGGIVFDAKWRNGDWPIVAKLPPVTVRPPWFVVGDEGLRNVRLVVSTAPSPARRAPRRPPGTTIGTSRIRWRFNGPRRHYTGIESG